MKDITDTPTARVRQDQLNAAAAQAGAEAARRGDRREAPATLGDREAYHWRIAYDDARNPLPPL